MAHSMQKNRAIRVRNDRINTRFRECLKTCRNTYKQTNSKGKP